MESNKIRFVTASYNQLQGLRLVPLGLILIIVGLLSHGSLDWLPLAAGIAPAGARARLLTWTGLACILMFVLAVSAPAYYQYRYGSVDPLDRGWRDRWLTTAVMGFVVLVRLDRSLHWPVSLSLLLISASLFITVWHDGRIRAHYLVPAVIWLAASVWPTLHSRPTAWFLGGLTLIFCGIGDHLLLARTLARPRMIDDASHSAAI